MIRPKVFGIGLSRTGTTSLNNALRILGYKSIHFPRDIKEIHEHEAATDITVAMRFYSLAKMYPESKFVYTWRDEPSWLRSCAKHFKGVDYIQDMEHASYFAVAAEAMIKMYDSLKFNREYWSAAYIEHGINVDRVFQEMPGRLLYLNICGGDGWEPLCEFLGLPVPNVPFPHVNRSKP